MLFRFVFLLFLFENLYAQTATVVYGQGGSFTSSTQFDGGISASSIGNPTKIVIDSNGNLYVSDINRVLVFLKGSTTATRVYGQGGSFNTDGNNQGGISANSFLLQKGIAVDNSGGLYAADTANHRVLYFPSGSTTATRVYGQGGSFTSNSANNGGISANSLNTPQGVAVDSSNNVYIADTLNNRVLFFSGTSTTATRVYGQGGSFTSGISNNGGTSATSLSSPIDIAIDKSNNIYVSDNFNNRVLVFSGTSTTATKVYGQSSFTTGTSGSTSTTLNNPRGITVDFSSNLYVGDYNNNRMLVFPSGSTTANTVYGQGGSFTANTANNGGISSSSLFSPYSAAVDNTTVYIADSGNSRILYYGQVSTTTSSPSTTSPANQTTSPSSTTCFHESTIITYKSRRYSFEYLKLEKECNIPHVVKTKGITIITSCGSLRLTPDHLIYTEQGLKPTKDIKIGDNVYYHFHTSYNIYQFHDTGKICHVNNLIPDTEPQNYFGLNCLESIVLANGIKVSTFGNYHHIPATWMKIVGNIFGIQKASKLGDSIATFLNSWNLL